MNLFGWLFTYILGGITFIPLVILLSTAYTIYTSEPVSGTHPILESDEKNERGALAKEKDDRDRESEEKFRLQATVRRTFEPQPADNSGSYVSSLRSLLATTQAKGVRKESAWLALKGHILYLYENEGCTDVMDVINLLHWDVSIYPSDGLLEGELFSKRNSLKLSPKPKTIPKSESNSEAELEPVESPYFIFIPSLTAMESTYHALLHTSCPPLTSSIPSIFNSSDIDTFISVLHSTSDPLPTRWFNALLARMFFAYYRTDALESAIRARINKKLGKIKRPGWLTALSVSRVDVGSAPPMISKPMLKNLTSEGEASVDLALSYKGKFRITLEATVTFSLPSTTLSRARAYTVHLLLSVTLSALSGNLLVLIKPPPSNRIWYAFTSPPQMELSVDPVVSDRQIKWGLVLTTIESRLREVIVESVVLPNMDDIPFFNSDGEGLEFRRRGGMWGDAARKVEKVTAPSANSLVPTSAGETDTDGQEISTLPTNNGEPRLRSASPTPSTPIGQNNSSAPGGSGSVPGTPRKRTWFGAISNSHNLLDQSDKAEKSNNSPRSSTDGQEKPSASSSTATITPQSQAKDTPSEQGSQIAKPAHSRSLSAGSNSISNAKVFEKDLVDSACQQQKKVSSNASPATPISSTVELSKEEGYFFETSGLNPNPLPHKAASIIVTDTSQKEKEPGTEVIRSSSTPLEVVKSTIICDRPSVGAGRGRTSSISSVSSAGSSLQPSSPSPYFSGSDMGGSTDPDVSTDGDHDHNSAEEADADLAKKTLSNTKHNSSTSFLSSLRGKNLRELRETKIDWDWKEGKEILSAQALGVVRKWGWKGRNTNEKEGEGESSGSNKGGSRQRPSSIGSSRWVRDRRASTATTTSGEEVDGEVRDARQIRGAKNGSKSEAEDEKEGYSSLRERVCERERAALEASGSSSWDGGYLMPDPQPGIVGERSRSTSLPPSSSPSSSISSSSTNTPPTSSTPTSKLSTSLPKVPFLSSISPTTPTQSSTTSAPSTTILTDTPDVPKPIHRSQPSAAQNPQMAIPGIPSSRKNEVMSISSDSILPASGVTAVPISTSNEMGSTGGISTTESSTLESSTLESMPSAIQRLSEVPRGVPPPLPPRRSQDSSPQPKSLTPVNSSDGSNEIEGSCRDE